MGIAYHQQRLLWHRASEELRQQRPDMDALRVCLVHHYKDPFDCHAALRFALCDNAKKAIAMIAQERDGTEAMGYSALTTAIANGPPDWLSNREYFYEKGLFEAGGKYYLTTKHIEKGSSYDIALRHMTPQAREIVARISIYAMTYRRISGGLVVGMAGLQYVAAQMMQEGAEKEFRLAALGAKYTKTKHSDFLYNSARALRYIAAEMDIDIDAMGIKILSGMPMGTLKKRKQSRRNMVDARVIQNISQVPGANENRETEKIPAIGISEQRRELQRLVSQNLITMNEAQIYLTHTSVRNHEWPTPQQTAKRKKVTENFVIATLEKVGQLLMAEKEEVISLFKPSNSDLHKARTVRP